MRTALVSTSIVLALALSRAPLRADRFDDAYKEAQAKLTSPEGHAYADRVAARFDEKKLRDALMDCAEDLPPEDEPPFTVLMELTADGRPNQVLLRPPAPIAVCLRWIIRESTFPRPPAPGYWVAVDLSTTRAVGAPSIPTAGVATATVPPTPTPVAPLAARPASSAPPPSATPALPSASSPTPTARTAVAPPEEVIDFGAGVAGFHVDKRRPDLSALRRTIQETGASFVGPILAQSDGIAPDDPRLEPYWSLAEELDLPAIIPLGQEPVGNDSAFRIALGDPLKLESVLRRHGKLRIVVAGAAWPFAEAMVGLMWRHPQVYVDTGVIAWSLPRAEFEAYLARMVRANLGDRILFASGASNPQRLAEAADRIRNLGALSPEAKKAIFRGNAERLLRR